MIHVDDSLQNLNPLTKYGNNELYLSVINIKSDVLQALNCLLNIEMKSTHNDEINSTKK